MPPVAAVVGGIGSLIGGAASAAAGIAGAAASAVGSVASGVLGGAAGAAGVASAIAGGAAEVVGGAVSTVGSVASGILGLGGAAAEQAAVPVMVGGEMGSLAAVSEAAALGVPAATGGISSGLATIFSGVEAGIGIYGQLAQIEMVKEMTEAQKIAAQKGLMEAEALKIYTEAQVEAPPTPPAPPAPSALESLLELAALAPEAPIPAPIPTLSSQPIYVTPAVTPAAAPNYMLYAGLAILAIIFLRKK